MKGTTLQQIPGYAIADVLFESARTRVLRAVRLSDQISVVLKILANASPDPAALASLRREFDLTQSVDSPLVPRAYDMAFRGDRWMMTLEDIAGESLGRLLPTFSGDSQRAVRVAIKICQGLGAIHARGIVHKDLNPGNIIYHEASARLQIIDFGISTQLSLEEPFATSPGELEGTITYISPEQTGRMNRPIDYRSDFYSLGVTLYELLTGHAPFASTDPLEIIHGHMAQVPTPFALSFDLPEMLERMVFKLLEKDPERRYQSAAGIASDLQLCLDHWQHTRALTLGTGDTGIRFSVPRDLYGREPQVASLLKAFTKAAAGRITTVLVQGASGMGKTAVVAEVQKPIVKLHGLFLRGKFDLYKQSTPYEPFFHAFRELIKQLVSSSPTALTQWQQRIQSALTPHGQVLVDVLPELAALTGPLPPVPELGHFEGTNRFRLVVEDFIHAVATPSHPLVLFLDDVQWADSSSLRLIEVLAASSEPSALLLILGFRSNDVGSDHPLRASLLTLKNRGVTPEVLTVDPLALSDVTRMIAASLRTSTAYAADLAAVCDKKTAGNPFFLRQMLRLLYERGEIFFVPSTQTFAYNLAGILELQIADNVVAVVLGELQGLPSLSRQVIAHAACIGAEFDLLLLASILDLTPHDTAKHLLPTLEKGLILPLDAAYRLAGSASSPPRTVRYRFAHDRIQEAAHELLPPALIAEASRRIGRYELSLTPPLLFSGVQRLYSAKGLLAPAELTALAALAIQAGQQAAAAAAHDAAFRFFALGIEVLGPSAWTTQADLCRTLHALLLRVAHYANESAQMEAYFTAFLRHTPDLTAQAVVQVAMIESLSQRARHTEALALGRAYLAKLGEHIPRRGSLLYTFFLGLRSVPGITRRRLARLRTDPLMVEQKYLAINRVMTTMTHVAVFHDPVLSSILAQKQTLLMLSHGISEDGLVGLANLACVCNSPLVNLHASASVAIEAALAQLKERNYPWGYARASYFAVGLIEGWTKAQRPDGQKLEDIAQACFDLGNYEDGCYALDGCLYTRMFTWGNLADLLANAPVWLKPARRYNLATAELEITIMAQAVANLARENDHPWLLDGEFTGDAAISSTMAATADGLASYLYWSTKGILACLFGEYRTAATFFAAAVPFRLAGETFAPFAPLCHIFKTFAAVQTLTAPRRRSSFFSSFSSFSSFSFTCLSLIRLIKPLAYMLLLARVNPVVNGWALHLMRAELVRRLGFKALAFECFRLARTKAQLSGYFFPQAFVNECLGRYCLGVGDQPYALQSLREARRFYLAWGALNKVRQLDAEFPVLAESLFDSRSRSPTSSPSSSRSPTSSFDLESILRSSQAVSSELQFDQLIKRVMKLTLENAGARQAMLFLLESEVLVCRVQGSVPPSPAMTEMRVPIQELTTQMCASIALYVVRTGHTLVLDDSHAPGTYQTDPYLSSHSSRSLACLPIEHQGVRIGVLYVENDLVTGAFTPERMKILALLAAQGAISLKNVEYVESLREKARLESDLQAATAVQQALLPAIEASPPGVAVTSYYQPAEQTGGDWFGSHYDPSNQWMFLQIGDVTGHGIPSALVTAAVCGAILGAYRLIASIPGQTLEQTVWHLAKAANDAVEATGLRVNRLMTMAFIGLNIRTGEGIYINAAHIPVYLVKSGEVTALIRGGEFLGEFTPGAAPKAVSFSLAPGDTMFMCTDGLLENAADDAQRFTVRELRHILKTQAPLDLLHAAIHRAYHERLGASRPADDCSYVILRISPV